MHRVPLMAVLLVASASFGAEPTPPPVRVPVAPTPPDVKPPAPLPDAAMRLTKDSLFVIDSDVPFLCFHSPKGFVKLTHQAGPITIRSQFVDSLGKVETRTYAGKYIGLVEGVQTGRVELNIVPEGTKTEEGAIFRILDVDMGTGPRPPPVDPVDPPTPPDPVTSFRVIYVFESAATLTQPQKNVIYGVAVENYLNANCIGGKAGWRRRDKDAAGELDPTMSALWNAVKPKLTTMPCVVIERNGKADILPIPPTPADQIAQFDKYRGVK